MKSPLPRLAAGAVLSAIAALAIAGLFRLELGADLFSLLPADSPLVEGLRTQQRAFGSSRELVLSLRAATAAQAEQVAAELSRALERSALAAEVTWRSPLRDDDALGVLSAYLWFNRAPAEFSALSERLRGEQLELTLQETLARIATLLRADEVARLSRDPLRLTDPLAGDLATIGVGSRFASADGRFRILFVAPPTSHADFGEIRRWVEDVETFVETRTRSEALGAVEWSLTGDPAFVAESGAALVRDMQWAATGTLLIVAGLFWLAHGHWGPLLRLVMLLLAVTIVTAGLGGLIFGTLNVVSLGFAAILLGLAADYGLILFQEHASHPQRSLAERWRAVAPSILWAAATTAGAFFMLTRSSLPGMRQLGTLVALGVLIAALVMLAGFLLPSALPPPAAREPRPRAVAAMAAPGAPATSWYITAGLIAAACLALAVQGLPEVDYGTAELGFREGRAQAALQEVETEVGRLSAALWVLVSGRDPQHLAERLHATATVLERAVARGTLARYVLPSDLWPRPQAQAANREAAAALAGRWPRVREAALAAGFAPDSLAMSEAAFAMWRESAAEERLVWPRGAGTDWVSRQFFAEESDRRLALGWLVPAPGASPEALGELADGLAGVEAQLLGWSLLSDSLLEALHRDLRRVLLPLGIVLLLALAAAFRSLLGVALSLLTLGTSLLALMATMTLAGWSWNLMNVMALALLLGAGVDYSIHMQLALRRYGGDPQRAHAAVGRAVMLCSASTAAGFGTLAFASNAGLASLGRICALGFALTGFVAVFLLPTWWRTLQAVRAAGGSD